MRDMIFSEQFEEIQKDRLGVVQSKLYPGLKELVSEIYPEEAHFIYELLQNAEDAKATSVFFDIQEDMLVFRHNGKKLFDADDVDSITSIAMSTKKENYVQAGKFGIGFKSVYAFTDTPYIYCDSVCFRIDKLFLPVQIDDLENRETGWTEFHFPFDSKKISPADAKKKIQQGLIEIESTTLLFLNNISELNYILEDRTLYCVTKEQNGRNIQCTVVNEGKIIHKDSWMRFSKESLLNSKNVQIDIAFSIKYDNKLEKYYFVLGEDKVCIKFLAKNEKSNLKFYINAPFGCTPARDTVNKGDKANEELIKEIASLMQTTIIELRDDNYLTDEFFELLPLAEDDVPDFYQPIVNAIRESFVERESIPTMIEGQYVTVENGILSRRNVINKIFTQEDIRILFQNNNLCFAKNRPINTRSYKFLQSLKIKELTPEIVLEQMTKIGNKALVEWLKKCSNEKLADLYGFLSKGIDNLEDYAKKYENYEESVINNWLNQGYVSDEQKKTESLYYQNYDQLKRVRQITIVKTSEDEFVKAESAYIVEQGINVPPIYKIVHNDLFKKEIQKRFLISMGVKTFTQKELQQYQYSSEINNMRSFLKEVQTFSKPLKVARKILDFLKRHKYDEINWEQFKVVYAKKSNKEKSDWHKVSECCLDKPLISETGLNKAVLVHKKYIVDDIYTQLNESERENWISFIKKGGALWEIRVKSISRGTSYITGKNKDYEISNLKQYLDLHSIELARYIWKSLSSEGGWYDFYAQKYYQLNKNHRPRIEESTVLKDLKNTKWVPDKNGSFRTPRDLSRGTIDSSFIIDESNGFLSAICFGANEKRRAELEKAKKEKEYFEQEQQREAAKRLGFKSIEDVLSSKKDAKKVEELREQGIDIDEIIEAAKKRKKEKERKSLDAMLSARKEETFTEGRSSDYDVAAIVGNPDRRREKIQKILSEGPLEKKQKVSVRKTFQSNNEEKQFLESQYDGKCQVCSKRIIRRDKKPFFEAINLFDTSKLKEEYLTGMKLGWNSVCLCPNCAAEYRYGAVSLYDFKDKVRKISIDENLDDYTYFTIQMQGEKRELKYSPVHLLNLQTALHFFYNKAIESKRNRNPEKTELSREQNNSTEIKRLDSGDRCPDCGMQNIHSTKMTVIDKNGNSQNITGIICKCGTKYLTRKLFRMIDNPEDYNIVEAKAPKINLSSKSNNKKHVISTSELINTHLVKKDRRSDNHRSIGNQNIKIVNNNEVKKCERCGKSGTVFNSGLCYECFKEERQSMYTD